MMTKYKHRPHSEKTPVFFHVLIVSVVMTANRPPGRFKSVGFRYAQTNVELTPKSKLILYISPVSSNPLYPTYKSKIQIRMPTLCRSDLRIATLTITIILPLNKGEREGVLFL